MKPLKVYIDEYTESHQNPVNEKIHKICVPAIFWSIMGLLHTVMIPGARELSIPVGTIILAIYLSFKNLRLFALMAMFMFACMMSFYFIPNLRLVCVVVFVIAWIGQFYGHHLEGKKPSFFKDLFFLLIGPLWIANKILPKAYRV
jgi:uncharacterized membrane protein YGL010W